MFLKAFFKNPRAVGAVAPSGEKLSKKMTEILLDCHPKVIVEYGPGTGPVTQEIIAKMDQDAVLIIIEQNLSFYVGLLDRFGNLSSIRIVHDSCENAEFVLKSYGYEKADLIVSGLPFTVLPKAVGNRIMEESQKILKEKGRFITFQYSLKMWGYFKKYFDTGITGIELKNIPPAFIFTLRKKGSL